ncbi:MAG: ABC transporter ATP-binding protein [Limisphaerales bacterium]
MNAVELDEVTKAFRNNIAVDNLSLGVPAQSIYGFIGPNGSGKTTTLRMILRILPPDRGTIRVLGCEQRDAVSGQIGYLPEERGLYKRMRVRPMLRFYGELKSGRRVDTEIETWLRRLDLVEHADKKIEALSKGSAQRVQFIAAVLASPDLVILDEPFSGLDPVHAELLRAAILDLRRQGTTVILSTHDMALAEQMCDFVFMIFRGRKVLDGTLASIQAHYGSDTIRVRTPVEAAALALLPGVESVRDLGQRSELRLQPGADPQSILRSLFAAGRVDSFEVAQPSLHDIFVRIAGCPQSN